MPGVVLPPLLLTGGARHRVCKALVAARCSPSRLMAILCSNKPYLPFLPSLVLTLLDLPCILYRICFTHPSGRFSFAGSGRSPPLPAIVRCRTVEIGGMFTVSRHQVKFL